MKRKPLKVIALIFSAVNLLLFLINLICIIFASENNTVLYFVTFGLVACTLLSVPSFIISYIDYNKTKIEEGNLNYIRLIIVLSCLIFLAANVLYVIYGV